MPDILYDLVDPAVLTGVAREVPVRTDLTLNTLLPDVEVPDVEFAAVAASITHGEAKFRAFDTPTPIGVRQAERTTLRGVYPPVGQKLIVGEYERLVLQRAQGLAEGRLARQAYEDTRSNVIAIRSRVERARGQVLETGKFSLVDENGLTLTADFGVPPAQLNVTPAVLWSDPTADVFGNLETWSTAYADANQGRQPGNFLTSRRVVNAARLNKQVIRAIYGPSATEGRVTPQQLNDVLADQGFPGFTTYDVKIGGTRVITDDKLIMTPSDPEELGRTEWGITADALELVQSNQTDFALSDAPGIVAVTLKSGDPVQIAAKATAGVLPVLRTPTLLFVAKVL